MSKAIVGALLTLLAGTVGSVAAFGASGSVNRLEFLGRVQDQDDTCGDFFTPLNEVHNGVTGDYWCPAGVGRHRSGRIIGPESRCGAWQYTCALLGPRTLTSVRFGGMFQITDRVRPDISPRRLVVPNALTGAATCPAGFSAVLIGRVLFSEVEIGADQYVCVTRDPNPFIVGAEFGGTFQYDDCWGGSDVVNAETGDYNCPTGFTAKAYGRVKSPEGGQCGATQYVCIR